MKTKAGNEYVVFGSDAYIYMKDRKGNTISTPCIIDECFLYLVQTKRLCVDFTGNRQYVVYKDGKNIKYLSHLIYGVHEHTIDHIDGDTFNNRINNLRDASMTIQNLNKPSTKGFSFYKDRYYSYLGINGKMIKSKGYKTIKEAMAFRFFVADRLCLKLNNTKNTMRYLTLDQLKAVIEDVKKKTNNLVNDFNTEK